MSDNCSKDNKSSGRMNIGVNLPLEHLPQSDSDMTSKRLYIKTFGCQMNRSDSELMAGVLAKDGYEVAGDMQSADVVLLNTCSVRKHAEEKVWSELGRLGILKRARGELILGVCGCMAQREGEGILRRAPFVDVVCGTHNFGRIAELVDRAGGKGRAIVEVGEREEIIPSGEHLLPGKGKVQTWVSIMRGCNNFCAYCVVPYLRGRERSRPAKEILEEVKGLVKSGIKEVTLLGQNVNSYRYRGQGTGDRGEKNIEDRGQTTNYKSQNREYRIENVDFVELLKMVNDVEGLERVRFVTSHPRDMTEEVLRVVSQAGKICEHLHLPLQAGSDRILKLMNRGYSREFYRDVISKARELIPGVAVTTDLIVGFPGEGEEDFGETFELVEEIGFDGAFMYKYSPRPGTAAEKMDGEVPEDVKRSRLQRLQELQKRVSLKKNRALIGQEVEVLVEGPSKKVPSKVFGRTRTNRIVVFEGDENIPGKLVWVKVKEVSAWTLFN